MERLSSRSQCGPSGLGELRSSWKLRPRSMEQESSSLSLVLVEMVQIVVAELILLLSEELGELHFLLMPLEMDESVE